MTWIFDILSTRYWSQTNQQFISENAMLWVPLGTAFVFAIVIWVLHGIYRGRQKSSARIYRDRYVQLVAQLSAMTESLNQLQTLVSPAREDKLLEYFESTLKIFETLLGAIAKISPYGTDPSLLDSAIYLAKDCKRRILRNQKAFRDSFKGKGFNFENLYGKPIRPDAKGCYFCSRPLVNTPKNKVKVKIDGKILDVIGCHLCRAELKETKKVKVLYFMKEGQPIHWSQMSDYLPSEDYWNINKRKPVRKETTLELIYSKPPTSL